MIGLGFLPGGSSSEAFAVSANGSVVVGESSSIPGRQAFGWSQETGMVGLGGFDSRAFDVSSNGAVIVGSDGISSQSPQAFIWDSIHGMRNLQNVLMGQGDDLTGWRLEFARGISADGLTVVGDGINPNGQTEAWLARLTPQQVPETPTGILFAIGIGIMSYHLRSNRRVTKTQVQSFGDR
jgi:probable HAF family extracellular repeat protein